MNFNDYQKTALTTALRSGDDFMDLIHWVLGLSGETGEITEKMKKILRDKQGKMTEEDKEDLAKEMGDVLWYLAVLAHQLGHDFDDIATQNAAKLKSRQERNQLRGSGDNR